MTNVEYKVDAQGILTIRVDLRARNGRSSSGKTIIVASTNGNARLPAPHDGIAFGLNVYTKGE
jgi:hypothetical protein